eukprot:Phypoly_transcript_14077.p1 GENE.Phypoly_transcript_14077~~Phypoly_transcript_14077.p1  ORF type:complete len:283 (+),score=29.27 Phypoly_transcript_14077:103-951(+)
MAQKQVLTMPLNLLLLLAFIQYIAQANAFTACSTNVNTSASSCWPIEYTCDAQGPPPNPSLFWTGDITNAKSYCILMDDPVTLEGDPNGYYLHWVVTDIPPQTFEITRGQSGQAGFPGTELKTYGGPCGGPNNMYRITVYAMPTATTTGVSTNMRGNQIDSLLRQTALRTFSFRVTNYRNKNRPNDPVACPDVPQVCDIKNGKEISDDSDNKNKDKKGVSPGAAAVISLVLIGMFAAGIAVAYIKYRQQGHLFGYTKHPSKLKIVKYQQDYDYKHLSNDSVF